MTTNSPMAFELQEKKIKNIRMERSQNQTYFLFFSPVSSSCLWKDGKVNS